MYRDNLQAALVVRLQRFLADTYDLVMDSFTFDLGLLAIFATLLVTTLDS